MAMLEVKDLQVYYGVIQALKGISFHVYQGEVIALIGANGAGKTTTLQTLTGILSPKSGSSVKSKPMHTAVSNSDSFPRNLWQMALLAVLPTMGISIAVRYCSKVVLRLCWMASQRFCHFLSPISSIFTISYLCLSNKNMSI